MSYLVLARKYRPQSFASVIDQEHVTTTLVNAIQSDRVAHAILFSGPRGTGKTTVARILAKAMNCVDGPTSQPCNKCSSCLEITSGNAVDVFEIDGASNNSVDQIRELRDNVKYRPAHSAFKIYIIDEVHMLSTPAFNALLKTLEEPPEHVLFVFATTEPHKIPVTILSRCQRHEFKRIRIEAIIEHMQSLCRQEGYDISEESLTIIAREAGGSMRDALSLLDQVMACSGRTVDTSQVLDILGVIDREMLFRISDAFIQRDVPGLLGILEEVYDRGYDMKKLYAELIEHFRNLLVVKMGRKVNELVDLPAHEIERINAQVHNVSFADLSQMFDRFYRDEASVKFAAHPKLALEMSFMRMFQVQPALSIDALIEKLDRLRDEIVEVPKTGCNCQPSSTTAEVMDGAAVPSPPADADVNPVVRAVPEAGRSLQSADSPRIHEDDLEIAWKKVQVLLLDSYPALAANLNKSRIRRLPGNRLEIEVNGNGFNLAMIQRKKNLKIIKSACKKILGEDLEISVTAGKSAEDDLRIKKKDSNRLKTEALSHTLVADAVEIFDGKVIDVKILEEDDS